MRAAAYTPRRGHSPLSRWVVLGAYSAAARSSRPASGRSSRTSRLLRRPASAPSGSLQDGRAEEEPAAECEEQTRSPGWGLGAPGEGEESWRGQARLPFRLGPPTCPWWDVTAALPSPLWGRPPSFPRSGAPRVLRVRAVCPAVRGSDSQSWSPLRRQGRVEGGSFLGPAGKVASPPPGPEPSWGDNHTAPALCQLLSIVTLLTLTPQ